MTTNRDPSRYISRSAIKRLQAGLEASFSPQELKSKFQIIHGLNNIPWITAKITSQALEKLKTNPNVAIIEEDRVGELFLDESG